MEKVNIVCFEKVQQQRQDLQKAFAAGEQEMLDKVIREVMSWEGIPFTSANGFKYTLLDALFELRVR